VDQGHMGTVSFRGQSITILRVSFLVKATPCSTANGQAEVPEMTRSIRVTERARQAGRGPRHGYRTLGRMSPRKTNYRYRRLADMSAAGEAEQPWAPDPDLPSIHTYRFTITVSEHSRYTQRLECDERDRVVEWAVVQSRLRNGRWQRVAVYDVSHGKGVHLHLYDRREKEFTQVSLRPVTCQEDVEDGLDYVMEHLIEPWWHENERRSDRGYY
jgi:hypothetical protein